MSKELYLYSPIYSFVAESLISQMEENMGTDVTVRLNTPGGGVYSSLGIYAKMREHQNVSLKVDGAAMSGGFFMIPYAKYVECLDVSTFMVHRADMYVQNDQDKALLAQTNKDLRSKLESRVSAELFLEVTGYSYDELFNSEKQLDVYLTAKQMKKLGLVNKVKTLTPQEATAWNLQFEKIAAIQENPTQTPIKMTASEIKEKHPEAYNAIVASERDRVGAWMAFVGVDPKAVAEGIKSGENISQTAMAEFSIKMMNKGTLEKIESTQPGAIVTSQLGEKTADEKAKALAEFEKSVDAQLKSNFN